MTRQRINIAGVRALYPVHAVTIWRKVREESFPSPHYLGSRRFWFLDEVEAWLATQQARPAVDHGAKHLRRKSIACPSSHSVGEQ